MTSSLGSAFDSQARGQSTNTASSRDGLFMLSLRELRKSTAFVLSVTTGVALIWIVSLALWPRTYKVDAAVSPLSKRGLSVLSGLASQLGGSLGTSEPGQTPQFFVDMALSTPLLLRTLLADSAIALSGLSTGPQKARSVRKLRRALTASVTPRTGVVVLSISSRDSAWARRSLAGVLHELDLFNQELRRRGAQSERRFEEDQLRESLDSLRVAEQRLAAFLESNRGDAARSPVLATRIEERRRQVAVRQSVFASLAQAYQQARLDEVRDTPVLAIIEYPTQPLEPNAPNYLTQFLGALLFGAALATAISVKRRYGWRVFFSGL